MKEPPYYPLSEKRYLHALMRTGKVGVLAFLKQYRLLVFPRVGVVSLDEVSAAQLLLRLCGGYAVQREKRFGYVPDFSAFTDRTIGESEKASYSTLLLNTQVPLIQAGTGLYDDLQAALYGSGARKRLVTLSCLRSEALCPCHVRTQEAGFLLRAAGLLDSVLVGYAEDNLSYDAPVYVRSHDGHVRGHLRPVNLDAYEIQQGGC